MVAQTAGWRCRLTHFSFGWWMVSMGEFFPHSFPLHTSFLLIYVEMRFQSRAVMGLGSPLSQVYQSRWCPPSQGIDTGDIMKKQQMSNQEQKIIESIPENARPGTKADSSKGVSRKRRKKGKMNLERRK